MAKTIKKVVVEETSEDSDESIEIVTKKQVVKKVEEKVQQKQKKKQEKVVVESSEEESSEEEVVVKKAPVVVAKAVVNKKKAPVVESSEEESSEEEVVVKKTVVTKKMEVEEDSDSDEDEEEEVVVKPVVKAVVKPVVAVQTPQTPAVTEFEVKVRGLSYNATKSDIEKLFSTFTKVKEVNIITDRETGKNRGFGFIKLQDEAALKTCLENSGIEHMGRYLEMEQSYGRPQQQGQQGGFQNNMQNQNSNIETSSIFVGNLNFQTDQDTLHKVFESCGEIINSRIAKDQEGNPRGFAHVDFADNESAKKALLKAGECVDGRPIRVDLSTPKPRGEGRGGFGGGRGRGDRGRGGDRGGFRGRGRGGQFDEVKNANKGNIVAFEGSKKKL